MKQIASILVALMVTGCTGHTSFGPCIGAFDDANPALRYETSTWNVIMAVVFVEMILPPIVVISSETRCPVGRKP